MRFSRFGKLVGRLTRGAYATRLGNPARLRARPGLLLLEGRCLLSAGLIQFPVSTPIGGMTAGPDGNIWFTEFEANKVGRMTPSGELTEFNAPTGSSSLQGITVGSDGNLWIADGGAPVIDRLTPDGVWTQFQLPAGYGTPAAIAAGPNGDIWFTDSQTAKLDRLTVTGQFSQFDLGNLIPGFSTTIAVDSQDNVWVSDSQHSRVGRLANGQFTVMDVTGMRHPWATIRAMVTDAAGNLWFTEAGGPDPASHIGRITPDGTVSYYELLPGHGAVGLQFDAHGNLWFTEFSSVGEISPSTGTVTEYDVGTAIEWGPVFGSDGNLWSAWNFPNTAVIQQIDLANLPAGASLISSNQGMTYQGSVSAIYGTYPTSSTATIAWGDGNVSTGAITSNNQGGFYVSGTNTYMQPGAYVITATVADAQGHMTVIHSTVQVQASPDAAFLDHLYQRLLNRSLDSVGSNEWLTAMNNGMTRQQVVLAIQSSPEYQGDLVQSDYQAYLGRSANSDEVNQWVSFLASGASQDQLQVRVLSSPEYVMRAGSTAEDFLQAVYHDVLGRSLDPIGRAAWLRLLGPGSSLATVVDSILHSAEAENRLVESYYQQYLDRAADIVGLTNWSNFLAAGGSDETFQAGILSSNEFFATVGIRQGL
jgi:streptogramin lyase